MTLQGGVPLEQTVNCERYREKRLNQTSCWLHQQLDADIHTIINIIDQIYKYKIFMGIFSWFHYLRHTNQ